MAVANHVGLRVLDRFQAVHQRESLSALWQHVAATVGWLLRHPGGVQRTAPPPPGRWRERPLRPRRPRDRCGGTPRLRTSRRRPASRVRGAPGRTRPDQRSGRAHLRLDDRHGSARSARRQHELVMLAQAVQHPRGSAFCQFLECSGMTAETPHATRRAPAPCRTWPRSPSVASRVAVRLRYTGGRRTVAPTPTVAPAAGTVSSSPTWMPASQPVSARQCSGPRTYSDGPSRTA